MTSVLLSALQKQVRVLDGAIAAELDCLRVLGTPSLPPRFAPIGAPTHERALLRAIDQRQRVLAELERTLSRVLAAKMEAA